MRIYPVSCYSFLHRAHLLQSLEEGTLPRVLLLSLCAVSSRFMSSKFKLGDTCAGEAKQLIMRDLECISATYLAAILLLLYHERGSCRFTSVFLLSSLASRLAYALQLNNEATYSKYCWREQECRRRLMWSCFVTDSFLGGGLQEYTLCDKDSLLIQLPCNENNFLFEIPCCTPKFYHGEFQGSFENIGISGWLLQVLSIRRDILM